MSYDNKNHYPKDTTDVDREDASGTGPYKVEEGSKEELKDRVLNALKACQTDMTKLKTDRKKYMKSYLAINTGKELKGRSQVMDSTSQDTIESVMPDMMRIFYGGKDVLEIQPREKEDVPKAKLMTEKVNFDIQKQNEGFKLIYQFLKDALMFKMGVVKYHWDKRIVKESLNLKGLSHEELMLMQGETDIVIKKVTVRDGDGKEPGDTVTHEALMDAGYADFYTYDATGYVIKERISKPVLENVPPEEFLFDMKARDIKHAFVAHKKKVHWKKLKKYGFTKDMVNSMSEKWDAQASSYDEQEVIVRFEDLGGMAFIRDKNDKNHVYIYECYIDDYDDDGNPINKKVLIFGDEVLGKIEDNSYGKPPFCVISPIIVQHRLIGRSLIELTTEIQELKTTLIRYILDNIYFQNNGMRVVNPHRIDVDSLLNNNKPGGVVLTTHDINPSDAIYNIPIAQLPSYIMKMVEYVDGPMRGKRTGVTDYNQGLDAKSLNKTATGISIITNAAQRRIELLARVMAETGMKDLYEAVVQMNLDYFDAEQNIRINKKWEKIDAKSISAKFDIIVEVGSFTSSSEMTFQQMQNMLNQYMQLGGGMAQLYGPESVGQLFNVDNIKNIIKKQWELLGFKNHEMYLAPDDQQEGIDGGLGQQAGAAGFAGGVGGQNNGTGGAGQGVAGPPPAGGVLPGGEGPVTGNAV